MHVPKPLPAYPKFQTLITLEDMALKIQIPIKASICVDKKVERGGIFSFFFLLFA